MAIQRLKTTVQDGEYSAFIKLIGKMQVLINLVQMKYTFYTYFLQRNFSRVLVNQIKIESLFIMSYQDLPEFDQFNYYFQDAENSIEPQFQYDGQQYILKKFNQASPRIDRLEVDSVVYAEENNQNYQPLHFGHNYNQITFDDFSANPNGSYRSNLSVDASPDFIFINISSDSAQPEAQPQLAPEPPKEKFCPERAYQQIVKMIKKKTPTRKRSRSPQKQSPNHNVPTFFAKHLTKFLLQHAKNEDLELVNYLNTPVRMSKQTIKVYMLASERLRKLCLYFFDSDLIMRRIFNSEKAKDKLIILENLPEYICGAMDPMSFNSK